MHDELVFFSLCLGVSHKLSAISVLYDRKACQLDSAFGRILVGLSSSDVPLETPTGAHDGSHWKVPRSVEDA